MTAYCRESVALDCIFDLGSKRGISTMPHIGLRNLPGPAPNDMCTPGTDEVMRLL